MKTSPLYRNRVYVYLPGTFFSAGEGVDVSQAHTRMKIAHRFAKLYNDYARRRGYLVKIGVKVVQDLIFPLIDVSNVINTNQGALEEDLDSYFYELMSDDKKWRP